MEREGDRRRRRRRRLCRGCRQRHLSSVFAITRGRMNLIRNQKPIKAERPNEKLCARCIDRGFFFLFFCFTAFNSRSMCRW